jgi:phosphatidylserine decarboxylase
MAKDLKNWIKKEVTPYLKRDPGWLSGEHFLRDPKRPNFIDSGYMFAPADGVIIYQKYVRPEESLVEIKGVNYTLKTALQDPEFNQNCYVIGIFMTFYNVHINRVSYPGFLSYQELSPILSHNLPMLSEENKLLEEILDFSKAEYMHTNQRTVNTIFAPRLKQHYYILQIADYDVDSILPFKREQNRSFYQNERFSIVRWGSQCDLIIPESTLFKFEFTQKIGMVIEAGLDTLVKITFK